MEVSHTKPNGNTADQKRNANLRRKNQRLRRKLADQRQMLDMVDEKFYQAKSRVREMELEIELLKQQLRQSEDTPTSAPAHFADPNVFGHRFAASMVALCVNLASVMPFRTASKALQIVLVALDIRALIPDRETIVRWAKRLGVDKLKRNQTLDRWKDHSDIIWIVDHSNQIGLQKTLVILALPASELPPEGQTLSLDALEVLLIEPAESWTRDDMRHVYRELADQVGRPRFVLCDGAVELREAVDVLNDKHHEVIVLRDFKHVAANRFESLIGRSEKFQAFVAEMGKTRSRIQQTELAHLNPPTLKHKARFMNVAPVIHWAEMILGVLADPEAAEAGITNMEKLRARLGWVRDFQNEIASWRRCSEVIGWSLAWINTQGLQRESGEQLASHLDQIRERRCPLSDRMTATLVEHVQSSASTLAADERSWLSSELLESVFGMYKRREGQQSRSGFTGLLATLPTLLCTWTAEQVRIALRRTSTKEAQQWITEKIGPTLQSKRAKALKHFGRRKCHVLSAL